MARASGSRVQLAVRERDRLEPGAPEPERVAALRDGDLLAGERGPVGAQHGQLDVGDTGGADGGIDGHRRSLAAIQCARGDVRPRRGGPAERGQRRDAPASSCDLGIITPDANGRFTSGHLRRAGLVKGLIGRRHPARRARGGDPQRAGLARLPRRADVRPVLGAQRRDVRGAGRAERACPIELLLSIRETAGSPAPRTDRSAARGGDCRTSTGPDRASKAGSGRGRSSSCMRAQGDGLRRIAETEASMWQAEVIARAIGRRHATRTRSSATTSATG